MNKAIILGGFGVGIFLSVWFLAMCASSFWSQGCITLDFNKYHEAWGDVVAFTFMGIVSIVALIEYLREGK